MAIIPQLSTDEWDELLERLAHHARRKIARLAWRGVRGGPVPGGVDPADLAAKALELAISGQRVWDRSAYPDYGPFLKGVVDSLISSLVRSVENCLTRRHGPSETGDGSPVTHEIAGREQEPIDPATSREDREAFRAMVFKALDGDDGAFQVLECLEADITKPAEIAAYLGLPVSEINNVQRRLRRKLGNLGPKRKGGGCG